MAAVTVFVDDAVQGQVPGTCVRTGVPAERILRIQQDLSGGLGAIWILVLLGPLGWLIFAVLALSRRRSYLTVKMPYSAAAADAYQAARRRVWWCGGVVLAVMAVLLLGPSLLPTVELQSTFPLAAVAFVLGIIAVGICNVLASRHLVGLSLDASGRWVTLSRVHPDFAAACNRAEELRREQATTRR